MADLKDLLKNVISHMFRIQGDVSYTSANDAKTESLRGRHGIKKARQGRYNEEVSFPI
jgi:hypothetical protein